MQWTDLWKARIGYEIDHNEAQIWEDEIINETGASTQAELISGVRRVSDSKRAGRIEYKPGLCDLIYAIIEQRKNDATSEQRRRDRMNEIALKIREVKTDGRKVWDIICSANSTDEMQSLESWAAQEFGFERPTMQELGIKPFSEVVKHATSGCGLANVTKEIKTRSRAPKEKNNAVK